MQILFADPRDRRGTKQRRAMLSVLHGLGATTDEGATPKKRIADAKAQVDAAQRALDTAMAKTSRDSYGWPSWSVGGPNILFTDLPDNFTSNDAANLDGDKLRRAIYGIVNARNPRSYFAKINDATQPVEERFAGWIWSRLDSRPGWLDENLYGSITRTVLDEGDERYFTNSLNWWTSQVTRLPDSVDLLVNRMVDPFAFHALEEPQNNIFSADVPGWTWGSVLGVIAGAAFVWVKRYAAAGREANILKATNDLAVAQSNLDFAQSLAKEQGYTPEGEAPGKVGADCTTGFTLNKTTGKCEATVEQSALPWILGGAAIIGLLLFTRRR